MRILILVILSLSTIICFGQTDSTKSAERTKHQPVLNDSSVVRLKQLNDSIAKVQEMEEFNKTNERNLNYLLEMQKERRAKEKKNAIIRIAIGLGFFIILIIGLRRRRAKEGKK